MGFFLRAIYSVVWFPDCCNDTFHQVTIECPWTAIPLAKIQWTHNGGLVQSKHQTLQSKGQRDFLYDSALVLEDSDTSHSGRYTCAATNPLGRDAAWSTVAFIGEFLYCSFIKAIDYDQRERIPLLIMFGFRATLSSYLNLISSPCIFLLYFM